MGDSEHLARGGKSTREKRCVLKPNSKAIIELRKSAGFTCPKSFSVASGLCFSLLKGIESGKICTEKSLKIISSAAGKSEEYWTELLDPNYPSNTPYLTKHRWHFQALFSVFQEWEQSNYQPGQPNRKLVVKSIGIDMIDGWKFLNYTINRTKSTNIDISIVMLADKDELSIASLAETGYAESKLWSEFAATNRKRVVDQIMNNNLGDNTKTVSISIRQYHAVPTIHGVHASLDSSYRIMHSNCRMLDGKPGHYDTCMNEFTLAASENGYEELDTRGRNFIDHFERLWSSSKIGEFSHTTSQDGTII